MLGPWPTVAELGIAAPLPDGYRYEQLSRPKIPVLIEFLRACYPGIEVGNASLDGEVLYGRIGAIAMMEALGQAMSAGMVYGLATLKYPQMQRGFEHRGWTLIGIMPGFDRELVEPGVVKRVYESVYVKLLTPESDLLRPRAADLTPSGKALFDLLYPGRLLH